MIFKNKKMKRWVSSITAALLLLTTFLPSSLIGKAFADNPYPANHVVISQVYPAGGNSGATYTNDFIELYNPTDSDVDLTNWSVQYSSGNGTGTWSTHNLSGTIKAHGFYLAQEAAGTTVTNKPLPVTSDSTPGGLGLGASSGKVALVNSVGALSGAKPTTNVVDLVGYGTATTANGFEGSSPAKAPSTTQSMERIPYDKTAPAQGLGNAYDSDDNFNDFVVVAVNPRNSSTPLETPMVPQFSSQPKGNLTQFLLNGTSATVKGSAGAVVANSTVNVYASASKGTVLTTVTAGADGSFTATYTASGTPTAVYLAATQNGLAESATTQINVAAASTVVAVAKLGYSVTSGTGTLIGNTGAATANAFVNIYSDAAKTTNLATVTAGTGGDFSVNITNAPDTVYVAQTTVTANGIMLEGNATAITKADTSVITAIKDVRAYDTSGVLTNLNKTFTIEGVATVDNQVLGTQKQNFYIQDDTGGINVYSSTYDAGYKVLKGDRIRVTGKVISYNGLAEFDTTAIVKVSEGNAVPVAKTVAVNDFNTFNTIEPLEGSLVTVTGKISATASTPPNWNVTIVDDNNKSTTLRIMATTGIVPDTDLVVGKSYTITGIVGQYDSSSPYTSGYQMYPREKKDIAPILQIQHTALTQVYKGADVQFEAMADGADTVTLYYRATGTTDFTSVAMTNGGAGRYTVTLPAASVPQDGFEYYIEAKQGTITKTAGSSTAPNAVTLVQDTFGPDFLSETPQNQTKIETPHPEISVLLNDPSGVNVNSIHFFLDGTEITAPDAVINQSQVKYNPTADLALGVHTVKVMAQDTKGNASEKTWTFEIVPRFTGGNHYRGTTHNHTNISHDAAGSPEDALRVTKDKYHYDFFAFTDHSHDIDPSLLGQDTVNHTGKNGVTMQERKGGEQWQLTKDLAKQYTQNGSFVVFPAFEMTSTTWGHSNVFGTDNFIDRNINGKQYQDLNKYYAWVLTYDDIVAQFNHPDMSANAFNNFKPYDKNVDKLFTMLEVGNGSGHYGYANAEGKFYSALDLGWHVAPTYGEDNHDGTWGQTNARTVIVANDLSNDSLLQSMKNMRVYFEEDPNFKLDVLANGYYMGSTVDSKTLKFNISGSDPVAEAHNSSDYDYLPTSYKSDDRIAKVELITNGGKVVDSITPMTKDFTWSPEYSVTSGQQWFVVKVTQADGERIYSSPIWSKEQSVDVKVNSVDLDNGVIVGGNPAPITATVGNNGTETINNLKVDFYYDVADQAHFIGSQDIASILSKGSAPAKATWANPLTGDHSIIVKVTSKDGLDIGNVTYTLPVKIKAPLGIKVMIDAAHANENTTTDTGTYKDNLKAFTLQMQKEGYTVVENKVALTDAVLSDVKVLVFTHSATALSDAERTAVANFVKNGGSLLMTAKSNNGTNNPTINNQLLADIGTQIRFGNDSVYDLSKSGNFWGDPTVSPWAVKSFPRLVNNYVTDRVSFVQFYSGSSLTGPNNTALTQNDKLTFLATGNETSYQTGVKNGSYVYDDVSDDHGGSVIPLIASEEVGQGRVIVAGMNFFNDKQMDESFNPVGNDELVFNSVNWLAQRDTKVTKISDARKLADDTDVVVEGTVTTAAGVFFDAFYLQDDTNGIMAYLEVPDGSLKAGDKVRVYGHLKTFETNKELEFTSFAKDVIKLGSGDPVQPKLVTTGEATSDANKGLLVKVTGKVVSKFDDNSYVINDGSGDVLVFTDGYIVNQSGPVPVLKTGDTLEAVGLSGSFAQGERIRVRDTKELIGTPAPDTTPPVVPVVNPVSDQALIISGTAEAGSTVVAKAGDVELGRTTAAADGKFEISIAKQAEGTKISITAIDAAGNTSAAAEVIVTDGTAPSAPSISAVTDADTLIKGTAEAGATVVATVDGKEIGHAVADENGKFEITISKQAAGEKIVVTVTDGSGNSSPSLEVTVTDATAPSAPSVSSVTDTDIVIKGTAEAGATVVATVNGKEIGHAVADENGKFEIAITKQPAGAKIIVKATDASGNISEPAEVTVSDVTAPTAPAVGQVTDADTVLKGTAEAGATVVATVNGKEIGHAVADENGKFEIAITKQPAGAKIIVKATDASGNISEPAEVTVSDVTAPAAPAVGQVTDADTVLKGTAEAGALVVAKVNGNEIGHATVGTDGKFEISISKQRAGAKITVTAADAAGNTSAASETTVIDVTAPVAPIVNGVTNADTVIKGTAEAGSTVVAIVSGKEIGRAVAGADGKFEISISVLSVGTKIYVLAGDTANNVSSFTEIVVTDGIAPAVPAVNSVTNADTVIKGTAEAGSIVVAKVNGQEIGRATANENGKFEMTIAKQSAGTVITITATDAAQNESGTIKVTVSKAFTPGWSFENGFWYFYTATGDLVKNAWVQTSGKWYYLSANGKMLTNSWVLSANGKWYYVDNHGVMVVNTWVQTGGTWYYLGATGEMAANQWISYKGQWYYLNAKGAMVTGWVQVNKKWYFLYSDGHMASNTTIGKYKVGKDGAWIQ